MPESKTLNEDLFYKGSSANLPRLHTCENKTPFWDKSKPFASQNEFKEKNFTITTFAPFPFIQFDMETL